MRRLIGWTGIAAVILLSLHLKARHTLADEKSAVEMLPASTAAYIEISKPGDVISLLLDSPLSTQIQKSPQFQKAIDDPKFQEFMTVVRIVEQKAAVTWRQALENGTAGGVVIAFDPDTQAVALLAKSHDSKITESIRETVFWLAREDAKNKGNPDPIETLNYRDLTAWKAGESVIAQLGPWLVITNKPEMAQKMADQLLDHGKSLAGDEAFKKAQHAAKESAADPSAWAFLRMDTVRAMATDQPWLDPKYKSENPAMEFLVGGLAPVLRNTPFVTAALTVHQDEVKLTLAAANDPKAAGAEKKFFFAPAGDGAAKPLRPPGTLMSVTMYRDISAMWQSGPDLFSDAIAAQMAQTDSNLSNLFGGKSFSTDVLGAIKPQLQLVLTRQDYQQAGVPAPSLRLPAGALILRIKPEQFDTLRKRIRVGFQSGIALANLAGGASGRPVLEMNTEKRGDVEIQYSTYDMSEKGKTKNDIHLNFSPALVLSKNYMMLCSTKKIAEDLADLIGKEGTAQPTIADNTLIEIDAAGAAALLKDDREQLIAQNMLEKGHDRPAAEKEIDTLSMILNYAQGATIRLTPTKETVKLEIDLKLSK